MIPSSQFSSHRRGISIIEVLTSIVVAMIGVFGVMVMIPFAIKQAETGLDRDAATAVARNAFAHFAISGFNAVDDNGLLNWTNDGNRRIWRDAAQNSTIGSPPVTKIITNGFNVYCIDPLGITENGAYGSSAKFPFNSLPELPNNLTINSVNLWKPAVNQPMDVALARRMFRATNDLVFGQAVETLAGAEDAELNGPSQLFDTDASGATLKRQSRGSISWCAIVVPVKDDYSSTSYASLTNGTTGGWKYRMYVLVFKDRLTAAIPLAARDVDGDSIPDEDNIMLTVPLDSARNSGLASPLSTVFLEPGFVVGEGLIRKDDWVMLINRAETDGNKVGNPAELGFEKQIAFARVVNYSGDAITLDGPDFNFDVVTSPDETHIVHLKNVVGIYERTFVLEGPSNWNISN